MSFLSRALTKLRFLTGKIPTQQHFWDLFDSVAWRDEAGLNDHIQANTYLAGIALLPLLTPRISPLAKPCNNPVKS